MRIPISIVLVALALILAASWRAQSLPTVTGVLTSEYERRVAQIEAMNLEHRLTRIETSQETSTWLLRGVIMGVATLLIERFGGAVLAGGLLRKSKGSEE